MLHSWNPGERYNQRCKDTNLNQSRNHRKQDSISFQSSTVRVEYLQTVNDPTGHTQRINKV